MPLAKISAIYHPVSAVGSVRQDCRFVHMASFRGSIGGRSGDQSESDQQNCCRHGKNVRCLQKGPFLHE